MAFLYSDLTEVSPYLKARKKFYASEAWEKMITALKTSTTLYIGNLSFYTDEEQIYTLFSLCGPVRRVIMGVHKYTHLPCGFCFVEYYFHRDAMAARDYLSGTKLDDRIIRVDLDPGFEPGRQFGRGATGGQVRDDRRHEFDEGRGGLPPRHKQRLEKTAITSGTLIGPTSGPLMQDTQHARHRYKENMAAGDENERHNQNGHATATEQKTADEAKEKMETDEPDDGDKNKDNDMEKDKDKDQLIDPTSASLASAKQSASPSMTTDADVEIAAQDPPLKKQRN